jgi:cytochrome c peroxidase
MQVTTANRPPKKITDLVMPVPADNPQTSNKIALGRQLFFEKRLSSDKSVSCATCHDPDRAFADGKPIAIGLKNRAGRRNSPAVINRGFGRGHFWDGRAATLEQQVLMPIQDPNEMDMKLADAVARLQGDATYRTAFQLVFERPISSDDLARALASYLRSITSADSPYDRFIAGDAAALTAEQQRGLLVFRGRANCWVCHGEPLFTDDSFRNTGISWRIDPATTQGAFADEGRFAISSNEKEHGAFKVPTLREVARTAPYMHDGSLATLAEVVDFYDRGGRPNPGLFNVIRPINLSVEDKAALVKFLEALSGTVSK